MSKRLLRVNDRVEATIIAIGDGGAGYRIRIRGTVISLSATKPTEQPADRIHKMPVVRIGNCDDWVEPIAELPMAEPSSGWVLLRDDAGKEYYVRSNEMSGVRYLDEEKL